MKYIDNRMYIYIHKYSSDNYCFISIIYIYTHLTVRIVDHHNHTATSLEWLLTREILPKSLYFSYLYFQVSEEICCVQIIDPWYMDMSESNCLSNHGHCPYLPKMIVLRCCFFFIGCYVWSPIGWPEISAIVAWHGDCVTTVLVGQSWNS